MKYLEGLEGRASASLSESNTDAVSRQFSGTQSSIPQKYKCILLLRGSQNDLSQHPPSCSYYQHSFVSILHIPDSSSNMAYNISRANTPPINAATKDISNTLPCTAAPVPPPDLAVEDDDGLAVDEGDL